MKLRNNYILLIILAMATLPFMVSAGEKHNIRLRDFHPDTVNVMVYDTVYLYDTVYEYIEVQETVIVYDTVTIYQMPVIGRPDTLFFVPHDSSVLPVQPLMDRYETVWSREEESDKKVETRKKNRHRDRWFSLSDETGNNPVPFGYGFKTRDALEYHAESLFPSAVISSTDQDFTDTLASRFYPDLSWRHNVAYHYSHNKIQISAGVALENMNFISVTNDNIFHVDTTFPWDYFQREVMVHDTTWFLDMDALLQGDSVWVPFVETTTTMIDDSVQVQKIDTSITIHRQEGRTRFIFLEVPVKFYYKIYDEGRWESTVWGGASAGLLLQQTGPYYSPVTGELARPGTTVSSGIQLKAMAGVRVDFRMTPITSVFLTAGYTASLTNMMSGAQYDYRYNAFSLGVGFKYQMFKNY